MGKDQELLNAARLGDLDKVEKLLSSKPYSSSWSLAHTLRFKVIANVNCQDQSGYSPLHFASLNDHKDIVLFLLTNSASTHIIDKRGNCPLHLAAWKGNLDIVSALLTHGPSISKINQKNKDNETALHFAAQYGSDQVVELLLKHGADAAVRNVRNESPLDLASQYGRLPAARLLVDHQPSLLLHSSSTSSHSCSSTSSNGGASNNNFTPLHLASRNGHLDIVRLLLDNGADINISGDNGTALHEASLFGKIDVVRLLLSRGVNPHATDPNNRTALKLVQQLDSQIAREIGQEILIRLQNGDDVDYDVNTVVNSKLTANRLRKFLRDATDHHHRHHHHRYSRDIGKSPSSFSCRESMCGTYDNHHHHIGFLRRSESHIPPEMDGLPSPPLPRVVEEKYVVTPSTSLIYASLNSASSTAAAGQPSPTTTPKTSFRGLLRTHWTRSSLSRGLRRSNSQRSSKSLPRLPSSRSRSREASPRSNDVTDHKTTTTTTTTTTTEQSTNNNKHQQHHPSSGMFPVLPVRVPPTNHDDLSRSTATLCTATAPASPTPKDHHDDNVFYPLQHTIQHTERQTFHSRRTKSLDPHSPLSEQPILNATLPADVIRDESPRFVTLSSPMTPGGSLNKPIKPLRKKMSSSSILSSPVGSPTTQPPPIPPKPEHMIMTSSTSVTSSSTTTSLVTTAPLPSKRTSFLLSSAVVDNNKNDVNLTTSSHHHDVTNHTHTAPSSDSSGGGRPLTTTTNSLKNNKPTSTYLHLTPQDQQHPTPSPRTTTTRSIAPSNGCNNNDDDEEEEKIDLPPSPHTAMKMISEVLQKAISHDELDKGDDDYDNCDVIQPTTLAELRKIQTNKFASEPSILDQLTTTTTTARDQHGGTRDVHKLPPLIPPRGSLRPRPLSMSGFVGLGSSEPNSPTSPSITSLVDSSKVVLRRKSIINRKPSTGGDSNTGDSPAAARDYVDRRIESLRRASLSESGIFKPYVKSLSEVNGKSSDVSEFRPVPAKRSFKKKPPPPPPPPTKPSDDSTSGQVIDSYLSLVRSHDNDDDDVIVTTTGSKSDDDEEVKNYVTYGPETVKRARIMSSKSSTPGADESVDDVIRSLDSFHGDKTVETSTSSKPFPPVSPPNSCPPPTDFQSRDSSPHGGVVSKRENCKLHSSSSPLHFLPLQQAFPSLERLKDGDDGSEVQSCVSSIRSRNTWDEQLSDRTEDSYLPACARKFRGLIRGANCKPRNKIRTFFNLQQHSTNQGRSSPTQSSEYSDHQQHITPPTSEFNHHISNNNNQDMTLETSIKMKLGDPHIRSQRHKKLIHRSDDDGGDSTPLSSSPSSISTGGHHTSSMYSANTSNNHLHHSPRGSFYDNDPVGNKSKQSSPGAVKKSLPDIGVIVDTVKAVRHSTQGSNTGSLSTSSTSGSDVTGVDGVGAGAVGANMNIDDEWAQIATIMSSVALDVSDGMTSDSTYSKEFEQTFWKLMTGKPKGSIQGWLHDIGLEQYEMVLVGNGFDNVEFLADNILEEGDLIDMDIIDYEHRRLLLKSCEVLPPLPIIQPTLSLSEWLESLHLQSFESELRSSGCTAVSHVAKLHSDTIHTIFKKLGHFKRVMASLRTLQVSQQQQQQKQEDEEPRVVFTERCRKSSTTQNKATSPTSQQRNRRRSHQQSAAQVKSKPTCQRQTSVVTPTSITSSEVDDISADVTSLKVKERRTSHHQTSSSSTSSRSSNSNRQQQMSSEVVSDLPDVKRAVYLASETSSGSALNLRPPNETTQQVSVSAWRHQPQVLISSQCTYQAQYLGSMLIEELKGAESTVEACAKMKKSTTLMKKMPLITLAISYNGVKFIDFESKHEIAEHDISNISFASQDQEDLNTFAYITHDIRTSKHYCHVFRVSTLDTAYEIILTIGQAFEIAYQLILKEQAISSSTTS